MKKLFKNLVNGFKINVDYYKSIANDDNRTYFCASEITEGGYILRNNTTKVVKANGSICLCTIVEFGEGSFIPCLYTDPLFYKLSVQTQEFVIQHELGHFNLHLDKLLSNKPIKRDINMEFQADEFARDKVGKADAIKALVELRDIGIQMKFGFGKHSLYVKEMNQRIQNLI